MTKGQGTEAGGMRTDVDKFNGSKFSQAIWDCRYGTGSLVRCGEPLSQSEIMVTWHGWGTESPPHVLRWLLQFLQ